ncbi:hypothetical protein CA260_08365 [Dyella jiangningensis]|uniref:DNA-directed RNA polymerase II n=1 Tax=Dyella jiangningensis TaxID=1379159 RepID=A0A328PBC8_9GAMM|nr:hypothetical protein CA260_08365 [Dyella jiangningensis]
MAIEPVPVAVLPWPIDTAPLPAESNWLRETMTASLAVLPEPSATAPVVVPVLIVFLPAKLLLPIASTPGPYAVLLPPIDTAVPPCATEEKPIATAFVASAVVDAPTPAASEFTPSAPLLAKLLPCVPPSLTL